MKTVKERAKEALDKMVESGLDCNAGMQRKIEFIVAQTLREHQKDVAEFVKGCYSEK